MSEYKLKEFKKSKTKDKKYDAVLINKNTGREKVFQLGKKNYQQGTI